MGNASALLLPGLGRGRVMQLSFYARGDILVPMPGQAPRPVGTGTEMASGPPAKYVARDFVPPVGLRRTRSGLTATEPAKYICSKEPFRCDSESEVGRRMVRHMTRKRCRPTESRPNGDCPLWPADAQTAEFLGVPFVPIRIVDGEAVPGTSPAPSAPAPSTGSGASTSKGSKGSGKGDA